MSLLYMYFKSKENIFCPMVTKMLQLILYSLKRTIFNNLLLNTSQIDNTFGSFCDILKS